MKFAMITSTSNEKIKLVRALQDKRRIREAEQLFVIEGVRLVEEALRAQAPIKLALHTDDLDLRGQAALTQLTRLGVPIETVTPKVMAAASDTETPQGLLAITALPPSFVTRSGPPSFLSFALILDGLSDPGNLGTILRTADAAGVEAVFLIPGTVDAYNPKVVRAGMGAHFHLPIIEASWESLADRLTGLEVWLAEAHAGEAYHQVDWRKPCALVIGSEAEGPSAAAHRFAHRQVHIPMPGQAESLNAAVAAGILLFEVAKQRSS
jgi:RNA methyltransferase, TrmH family